MFGNLFRTRAPVKTAHRPAGMLFSNSFNTVMFQKIIAFSLQNKPIVGLFIIALILTGLWSFSRLPIDAMPDITNNQAQVLTVCPTLATQEVEQYVTAPIENAVRNLPGVVELRSISRFGLSVITVVFREDMDLYRARTLLNEKLQTLNGIIPRGAGQPDGLEERGLAAAVLAAENAGRAQLQRETIKPSKPDDFDFLQHEKGRREEVVACGLPVGAPGSMRGQ